MDLVLQFCPALAALLDEEGMRVELQLELPVLLLLLLVQFAHLYELEGVPAHLICLFGELLDHLLELLDLAALEGQFLVALDDELLHEGLALEQSVALGQQEVGLELGGDEGGEGGGDVGLVEERGYVLLVVLQLL